MTIYTTLNKIRACSPCTSGWRKLLAHLGKSEADDEPLAFATILESNGLDDTLWATRSAPEHDREWRSFAVWCARRVQHLMPDLRSIHALDIAERFAKGEATDEELAAAREDAMAAAEAMEAMEAMAAKAAMEAMAKKVTKAAMEAKAAAKVAAKAAAAAAATVWTTVWTTEAAVWAMEAMVWDTETATERAERDAQTAQFLLVVS